MQTKLETHELLQEVDHHLLEVLWMPPPSLHPNPLTSPGPGSSDPGVGPRGRQDCGGSSDRYSCRCCRVGVVEGTSPPNKRWTRARGVWYTGARNRDFGEKLSWSIEIPSDTTILCSGVLFLFLTWCRGHPRLFHKLFYVREKRPYLPRRGLDSFP